MNKYKKSNKGITLVALVITIIILLILAGIAINSLTNSGLLTKAGDAVKISKLKEIEEFARLSYMERQIEEITEGKGATIAGVINDLKEKGYKIKQITEGENSITGISLGEENITVERNTEKTLTYTLIYSEETTVRYFVEVEGKDYEILFNSGNITVNTEETDVGESNEDPEVTVTSSDSTIIEANKTEEGKIVLTAKNELGDVEITIKETNSNVTKILNATTKIPATELTISKETATVELGKILQLTAATTPSNTTDLVNWTSSDKTIATVSNTGLVTGLKEGTATITVTCGSQSKICNLKIKDIFEGINTSDSNPKGALPSEDVTVIESDASRGIVIETDYNNNKIQWVWVQVPKTTVFKTAKSNTDYVNIKNDLITYAGVYRKGAVSQNKNWTDVWYSGCGIADSSTYTTMYNKMLSSVYTNGGFWIQRYEDEEVNITCHNAQIKASGYAPDITKTSSLLFGIQWDLVCKYLEESYNWPTPPEGKTNEYYLNEDSSSWGRYGNNVNTVSERSEYTNRMNIYDFAGNNYEWTLEHATDQSKWPCVTRGSCYVLSGSAAERNDIHGEVNASTCLRATFY